MYLTPAEALTAKFYEWEERGRGWYAWDRPVELEPPFVPFFHSYVQASVYSDDGRKPTILSSLVEGTSKWFRGVSHRSEAQPIIRDSDSLPRCFADSSPLHTIIVSLIPDEKIIADQAEHFLLTLSQCALPVCFEVVGSSDEIVVQFTCRNHDLPQVKQELHAYFPNIVIEEKDNGLPILAEQETVVVDFGLSEEFMRPLKIFSHLEPDPMVGIIGALDHLHNNELGMMQVLFQATHRPWSHNILQAVTDGTGGSFFEDAPEMIHLAREKTKRPLFAAVLRVLGASDSKERAWQIAKNLSGSLSQLAEPYSNELIPLTNDEYDDDLHLDDVLTRQTHRSGMILNSEELASLVHLPSTSVRSLKLQRSSIPTRPAPQSAIGHECILGENVHRGKTAVVSLSVEERLKHLHVIGATGTGKSTLLLNLIVQDIEHGNGLAVIDPHGDLIEKVMGSVSRKRIKDVVLFDPSDAENPHGLNVLAAKTEAEKNVAASDLVAVFRRMSTSWGDQMTVILGNAIQAFLESDRGGSLIDLRKFLLEEDFREEFLRTVSDRDVRYFWDKQHHILRGNTLGSILTRLDTFLRPKLVRKVIAPQVELDFASIMNGSKILLVKLAQGLIGEENSTLLGTLVVSKLHQAAMSRQAIRASDRTPFFLHIDEFQNFITPSLAGVLSGTRKYGLGLILAHQELRQIFNQDSGVANSVISNPGVRICFRLGDFDAEKLKDGFQHFSSRDLQNLSVGEVIARIGRSDDDFNLRVFPTEPVNGQTAKARVRRIIELSRLSGEPDVDRFDDEEDKEEEIELAIGKREPLDIRGKIVPDVKTPIQEVSGPPLTVVPQIKREQNGASQHRYLQTLIKRMAEDRGFRAVIEEPTPDGSGRVDVGLERDGEKIACEIALTTKDGHELLNIQKCLAAGYKKVIVCSTEKKRLQRIEQLAAETLRSGVQSRLFFLEPDSIFSFMEEHASSKLAKGERVKGYRVKVQYEATDDVGNRQKRDAMAKVILQSVQKLKKNNVK